MSRLGLHLVLLVVCLVACQAGPSALDQAATVVAGTAAAAPPVDTPPATSTLPPTQTLAPRPTVTPALALTSTLEAFKILTELDVHVGQNSGVDYEQGRLAWQQAQPVALSMSGPQKDAGILEAIDPELQATNFVFKAKVTWEATGVLICGLAFRAETDLAKGRQYQFYFYRVSGVPAYRIDVYEAGRFKSTISGLKYSDGIDSANGGQNEFVLVVKDGLFTVLVNGRQQGRFNDTAPEPVSGGLAFLAWQDSGQGSCAFTDSWLWVLP